MHFYSATLFAATLAVAPFTATGHMFMSIPTPFQDNGNNGPLAADGSNYPCKGVSYSLSTRTQWPVGTSQMLKTSGTAVHGGGSCQISVTYDKDPKPTSKFKVIYSIEGGCPANPAAGGNMAGGDVLPTFNFTIPPELPNGEAVMAWTWMNKVGNREFYMNCGPVTITGGAKDSSAYDALPDMAVANIKGPANPKNCQTPENSDVKFSNPGKYVTTAGKGPFVSDCGGAPAGGSQPAPAPAPGAPQQSAPKSSQQAAPTSAAPAPVAPAPVVPSPAVPSSNAPPAPAVPALTSTVRKIVTVTASSGSTPTLATAPQGGKVDPAPAPSAAPGTPAGGNANTDVGTCDKDGLIVCNGTDKFALCNRGKAVWQAVAQGTTCKNGQVQKRGDADYNTTLLRLVRSPRVQPEA